MARLIFKAPYYKPGRKAGKGERGEYAKYIATRDGVELLRSGMADYIDERKGSNGLFSDEGVVINLSQIEETINNYSGNVWGLIFSLKREDAERLGYNSAVQWMNLLRSHRNDIAREMHIAPGNLRWYAAYHNSETHPHVHMLVWSDKPQEPHLSTVGIHNIKQTIAKDIFRQDLISIYKEQTQARDDIKLAFSSRMEEIIEEISGGTIKYDSEIVLKLQFLSEKLSEHKGKKVYGYLDKGTKKLVDEIVRMIAGDERIAELYDLWHKCRCETFRTYTDAMPEKIPLEENKEFKSIRNEVVRIASDLKTAFDFYGKDDSEPSDETEEEDLEDLEYWSEQGDETQMYLLGKKYLDEYDDPEEAEHWLKKASENGNEYAMYLLYKCYRDGRIEDKENEKMKYLKMALNKGYDAAEYEYGKLLREKEPEEAMKYLGKAADQRNPYAAYAYAKMCSDRGDISKAKEYFRIAVMYKPELGFRVGLWYYYEQNERENGKAYLQFAAERGDTAAEEALKAINNGVNARLLSGVLNLFRHASRVIDDRAKAYAKSGMMQGVDKKLREQIRRKKEGLGMRMG